MSGSVRDRGELIGAVWADLLQGFWEERGTGARYRTVEVGVHWFTARMGELAPPDDPAAAMEQAITVVRQEGLVEEIGYELKSDFADYAELRVRGCALHAGELALRARGCEPYACVCANVAMHVLEKCTNLSAELARVKVTDEGCLAQVVFFRMPE